MSVIDIIILLMLFFGLWQGFQAGLLRSLVSLFGWLFALVCATYFAQDFAYLFSGVVSSPILTVVIAFIAIALCVIIGLQVILWLMRKTMDGLKLSPLDKLGGAIFGCGKSLLMVLIALSLVAPLMHSSKLWQDSQIAPALLPYSPFAMELSKKMASQVATTTTGSLEKLSKPSPTNGTITGTTANPEKKP